MSTSSQISPLLDRVQDPEKSGICNKLRSASLYCQPLTLLLVLALCITALLFPFWKTSSPIMSQTASHPFIEKTHVTSFADTKQYAQTVGSDALSDLVSSLPGLSGDSTITHYSGYVDALEGRQIHYWYFEAAHKPEDAPVIFWTNGGPGCSGLCGLLTEHGPFWAVDDDQLMENPFSWNKIANMVYFEQPYGVGFSTVDYDSGFEAISGDDAAVADFDAAIRSFLRKFPEFEDREIYISSESFGGHYMPLTALEIMKNNELDEMTPKINFQGFMVGNPYTNGEENTIGAMEAFYGHGLMRESVYETWKQYCFADVTAMSTSPCHLLYATAYYEATNIDHYALDFDYCVNDVQWQKHRKHLMFHTKMIKKAINHLLTKFNSEQDFDEFSDKTVRPMFDKANSRKKHKGKTRLLSRKELKAFKQRIEGNLDKTKNHELQSKRRLGIEWTNEEMPYYSCAADLMTNYLNNELVQQSLHVKTTDWEMCSDSVFEDWPEDDWDNKMQPYYAEIAAKYPQLKIMIFSGDDDSVCGLQGTQYWLDNMSEYGWTIDSDNEWLPWEYDQQLAGYCTIYKTKNGDTALRFHTVRTAGHMVPQTQPQRALALLKKYLKGDQC